MRICCFSAAALVVALAGTVGCKSTESHKGGQFEERAHEDINQMTVTDASILAATEIPRVVVFVDKKGAPIRTLTQTIMFVPPVSRKTALKPTGSSVPKTTLNSVPSSAKPTGTKVASATASPSSSATVAPGGGPVSGNSSSLHGIAYAPYNSAGKCKSAEQVEADFATFKGMYSVVRMYGTDCNQVVHAYKAAKKADLKLFLGLFEIGPIDKQVSDIVSVMSKDWSVIDTISVGNELVNNGQATPQEVITAMGKARGLLRAAGYTGPVVTVDTFVAVQDHPELCDFSDYCAINVHPFFDGHTPADGAGEFVLNAVSRVRSKLSTKGKRVVVSETGWPWQGVSNREAIPGLDQQQTAIDSIRAAFSDKPNDLILFSAFNDLWKPDEAKTFFAERYWGIGGVFSAADK